MNKENCALKLVDEIILCLGHSFDLFQGGEKTNTNTMKMSKSLQNLKFVSFFG